MAFAFPTPWGLFFLPPTIFLMMASTLRLFSSCQNRDNSPRLYSRSVTVVAKPFLTRPVLMLYWYDKLIKNEGSSIQWWCTILSRKKKLALDLYIYIRLNRAHLHIQCHAPLLVQERSSNARFCDWADGDCVGQITQPSGLLFSTGHPLCAVCSTHRQRDWWRMAAHDRSHKSNTRPDHRRPITLFSMFFLRFFFVGRWWWKR